MHAHLLHDPIGASLIDGDREWTADQLQLDIDHVAGELAASVSPTARVAILARDVHSGVVGVRAAAQVGLPFCVVAARPIAPTSPEAGRTKELLVQLDASVAIGPPESDTLTAGAYGRVSHRVSGPEGASVWCRQSSSAPHPPTAVGFVSTSGSTGPSKLATLTTPALDLAHRTNDRLYRWQEGDRLGAMLPLTHLAGLTNVLHALTHGVDVVAVPPIAFREQAADTIESAGVTVLAGVPLQLQRLYEVAEGRRLDGIRLVASSAAPLTRSVTHAIAAVGPQTEVVNSYGLTEAFRTTYRRSRAASIEPANVGTAVDGAELRLEQGEIWVRGPHVSPGYWNAADGLTPMAVDGWLATGDHGEMIDSELHLVGRRNQLINIAGEKQHIEQLEAEFETGVGSPVAVATRPDADGHDEVVMVTTSQISTAELLRSAGRTVAPVFRPRAALYVDRLPLTPSGKIDRAALSRLVQDPEEGSYSARPNSARSSASLSSA